MKGVGATTGRAASAQRTRSDSSTDAATRLYFGSGCFWGRQHDQVTEFEESQVCFYLPLHFK